VRDLGSVVSLEALVAACDEARSKGRRLSFANGHFDLLHVGHLRYLVAAKATADVLIVAVNDDRSVARLKGAGRPLVPASDRAELVAALDPVDYVILFSEDTPAALLHELQPDIHCKGTDYGTPQNVPEFDVVRAYGGETRLVGDPKDHATRDMIRSIQALDLS
jgi:rfaE bifunctional protein nucleotidyltransferase chain/domain